MKGTLHLLILSAALISGCASAAPPPQAAKGETFIGYVTPYVGAHARDTFKVTTDGISSPRVQISRVDEGFRGVVQQKPIDLRIEKAAVTGSFAGQPINLRIAHRDGKLWVEGLYGGKLSGFFFSERPRRSNLPCSELQPWISISEDEEGEPTQCDVESVKVLETMRAYLDEPDAAALLAVMLLSGSSFLPKSVAPPVGRSLGSSGASSSRGSGAVRH